MRALPLLFALALAGCAASLDAPSASDGPTTLAWGITGCAFVIAAVPVDAVALAAFLPEGFALAPGRLADAPAGPRATIELDAYHCERGIGTEGETAHVDYGSYYTAVVPPDALREEGYDAYFVKWDHLAPDAARRDALAAAGLPAHDGEAPVLIQQGIVDAQLTFEDGGGFRVTGAMGPLGAPGDPLPFMEYTPLANGTSLARWHARLHDASIGSGAGVVELQPGWVRDLVGADRAPATFIAGRWNLDEADVTFPIKWP